MGLRSARAVLQTWRVLLRATGEDVASFSGRRSAWTDSRCGQRKFCIQFLHGPHPQRPERVCAPAYPTCVQWLREVWEQRQQLTRPVERWGTPSRCRIPHRWATPRATPSAGVAGASRRHVACPDLACHGLQAEWCFWGATSTSAAGRRCHSRTGERRACGQLWPSPRVCSRGRGGGQAHRCPPPPHTAQRWAPRHRPPSSWPCALRWASKPQSLASDH